MQSLRQKRWRPPRQPRPDAGFDGGRNLFFHGRDYIALKCRGDVGPRSDHQLQDSSRDTIPAMSEDSPNLTNIRALNSPDAVDLRRVGAHPDYWYPLAWSDELKVGKAIGRRFAGDPSSLYRGIERPGVRARGSLRPPPGSPASGRGERR